MPDQTEIDLKKSVYAQRSQLLCDKSILPPGFNRVASALHTLEVAGNAHRPWHFSWPEQTASGREQALYQPEGKA